MNSSKYYHTRTALGAVIQRMRHQRLCLVDSRRLSERPTLLRWDGDNSRTVISGVNEASSTIIYYQHPSPPAVILSEVEAEP